MRVLFQLAVAVLVCSFFCCAQVAYGQSCPVSCSGSTTEISGSTNASSASGVYGEGLTGTSGGVAGVGYNGVVGQAFVGGANGVEGMSWTSTASGVYGENTTGFGVAGRATNSNGIAIYGDNTCNGTGCTGLSGKFTGRVLVVGNLIKQGGGFKIDHPLDPDHMYLYHSFVESPDMKNIYDGVIQLDAHGEATVILPDLFESVNDSFRYQLTCVGGWAPVFVAQEIKGNHFRIAGGAAGQKVSWQVTGIRRDVYAKANRIPVEEKKPPAEVGHYLFPAGFGKPEALSVAHIDDPRLAKPLKPR